MSNYDSNETENINCELYSSVSINSIQILNNSNPPKASSRVVVKTTKSIENESLSGKDVKTKKSNKKVKVSSKESSTVASIELSVKSNKTLSSVSSIANNVNNDITNDPNATNLVKDFRKAKSEDINIVEINKEPGSLTVATCNPGGLRSKFKTVENFCFRNDIGALAVCETHFAGRQKPFISKNYQVFHKD